MNLGAKVTKTINENVEIAHDFCMTHNYSVKLSNRLKFISNLSFKVENSNYTV